MRTKQLSWIFSLAVAVVLSSCGRDPNDQGTEYAPQMYVSKAYEPFTQVEGEAGKNTINANGLNMRVPPAKTIARRRYNTMFEGADSTGKPTRNLLVYDIHKDSIQVSMRLLKNPFQPTKQVMEEGQVLYTRFCSHCHGEKGDGNGPVNKLYKGVANISSAGALKNLNGGHIYHVITHGKGRMWAHSSLVNPDERWKIVWYVHTLQGQDIAALASGVAPKKETKEAKAPEKTEAKAPEKK